MLPKQSTTKTQSDKERIVELEEAYAVLLAKFRAIERLICKKPSDIGEAEYHFFQPKPDGDAIDF